MKKLKLLLIALFSLSGFCIVSAAETADSAARSIVFRDMIPEEESLFPSEVKPLNMSHFTWGVDIGASIDLSGYDMSTLDADAYFGYKGSWIRTAAVGAGVHKAFGNQYTFVPVYALVRTSFRRKPSLVFFELKGGYSFNTLHDSGSHGGAYGSVGVGVNLAMTRRVQSHLILSYGFFTLKNATDLDIPYHGDNISSAVIRFGINF